MPVPTQIEAFDPTRLRDSLQCLRLYYWRHERKIVSKGVQMPLAYGTAVHETLAAHYAGQSLGECLAAFDAVWERDVLPYTDEFTEDDPKRNPQGWLDQFSAYRDFYATEPFSVLQVEAPFFYPLPESDLALCGVIDLLIEYLGQIMVLDHKTTSIMYQSYFDSFNPNHQFTAYLLGASRLLNKDVNTLMVNCILTTMKLMAPEKMFVRYPTTRSAAQLAAFEEEIKGWWQIIQACRQTGNWPRNDDRCQRWKGGCPYHPLCTDIQADYRRLRPSPATYVESQWDPIRNLREHGLDITI